MLPELGLLAMESKVGEQRLGFLRGGLGHLLITILDVKRA
jgi:hypothetical protein